MRASTTMEDFLFYCFRFRAPRGDGRHADHVTGNGDRSLRMRTDAAGSGSPRGGGGRKCPAGSGRTWGTWRGSRGPPAGGTPGHEKDTFIVQMDKY